MKATPTQVLARPLSYRLWMAPFAEAKFAPVLRHNDLTKVRRVLDVGCGPGTNAHHFAGVDYLGIDVNERYVEYARRHHAREFAVADATEFTVGPGEHFDFVLINSFLHHIPDDAVKRLLGHLSSVLSGDGHIHVMDLELPERPSTGRLLARMDRGEHPRPLREWRRLFTESFEPVVFEPYRVGAPRWAWTTFWNMVYFKGRARAAEPTQTTRA